MLHVYSMRKEGQLSSTEAATILPAVLTYDFICIQEASSPGRLSISQTVTGVGTAKSAELDILFDIEFQKSFRQ